MLWQGEIEVAHGINVVDQLTLRDILEYPCGSSVITRVFKLEEKAEECQRRCGNGSRDCSDRLLALVRKGVLSQGR